jgi:hypothetical protein
MCASNFLLWQISYAEPVITPALWPDFRKPQFFAALEEYAGRKAVRWSVNSFCFKQRLLEMSNATVRK